ncbi:hypothetical protein ACLBKS_01070 [Hylemonella sp. W303a]|uniref:hypothetical protein n=1 Tax=Hylemonella sp. W303a TaxID=3389873 RepID=UPI00396B486C
MAALAAIEICLRAYLFDHVSYSNSASIDAQLRSRKQEAGWTHLFVGDSEVRWGIDPAAMDQGLLEGGLTARSFNHAFDGFGATWWLKLLPQVLADPSLAEVKTVVVGIQLIDIHRVMSDTVQNCGALQKPVLTSPFAVDLGLDGLCNSRSWDAQLGRDLFNWLWIVRYAPAVRSAVLPKAFTPPVGLAFNSRSMGPPYRGFQPHHPIEYDKSDYAKELERWRAQYVPERDFRPMPKNAWRSLADQGGFFDELQRVVGASGRRLALFALPTNPVVIDTFQRRADYLANSRVLAEWAAKHDVTYVDLGIQDRPDAMQFFSDMRHLSGIGAADFSRRLGRFLAQSQGGKQQSGME